MVIVSNMFVRFSEAKIRFQKFNEGKKKVKKDDK